MRQIEWFMNTLGRCWGSKLSFLVLVSGPHEHSNLSEDMQYHPSDRAGLSKLGCPLAVQTISLLVNMPPTSSVQVCLTRMCCNGGKQKLPSLSTLIPKASLQSVLFTIKSICACTRSSWTLIRICSFFLRTLLPPLIIIPALEVFCRTRLGTFNTRPWRTGRSYPMHRRLRRRRVYVRKIIPRSAQRQAVKQRLPPHGAGRVCENRPDYTILMIGELN